MRQRLGATHAFGYGDWRDVKIQRMDVGWRWISMMIILLIDMVLCISLQVVNLIHGFTATAISKRQ